jgi:hypothetical protein
MPHLKLLEAQTFAWFALGSSFALTAAVVAGLVHF